VVRIETERDSPPTLSSEQREQAVLAIAELANSAPVEIQISTSTRPAPRAGSIARC
jgi:hypothetical protein